MVLLEKRMGLQEGKLAVLCQQVEKLSEQVRALDAHIRKDKLIGRMYFRRYVTPCFRFLIVSKEEIHSTHSQESFIRGDVYVAIQITANQVISMAPDASSTTTATQRKTAEKRLAQVNKGIELLDLWLNDLVRNGLGNLETQPATFWEKQAAQMVDAQIAGLASYIRRLASIPNASPDWSEKLLARLGNLALLTQAFHRMEQLDAAMQEDIRQLIGWNLKEEEVLANGEHVTDNWLLLGQAIEDIERGRAQRTWLLGTTTRRSALLLQFSFAGAPFSVHHPLGIC